MAIRALLGCALLLISAPAGGLDPATPLRDLLVSSWASAEGLGVDSAAGLLQTEDGYLWFATEEGVVRFNGERFDRFDPSNLDGLPSKIVWAIAEQGPGALWLATDRGVVRLLSGPLGPRVGGFFPTPSPVSAILVRNDGELLAGTEEGQLFSIRNDLVEPSPFSAALEGHGVRALLETHDGTLWIGTRSGLYRAEEASIQRLGTAEGLPVDYVTSLAEDGDGALWIGTNGGGLVRRLADRLQVFGPAAGLPVANVLSLAVDHDRALWVGTNGGGLCRLRGERFECRRSEQGLSSNLVYALAEDREGGLWAATSGGGVMRLRESHFVTYAAAEGLASDIALALFEDRHGTVWIGSGGAGLTRVDGSGLRTYSTRDGLPHDVVLSFADAADGGLWIGTAGGGLTHFDGRKFRSLTVRDGLSSDLVQALLTARDGSIWIGTNGGGLSHLRDGKIEVTSKEQGLCGESVLTLLEDRHGTIWAGTRGTGLCRIAAGKPTATGLEELAGKTVLSLAESPDGTIWAGTLDFGLARIRPDGIRWITKRTGLADSTMGSLLLDGQGWLWMGSNVGVSRARLEELDTVADGRAEHVNVVAYGKSDGMRSAECNGGFFPSAWRGRDGRLWYSTMKGVAVVDPRQLRDNADPPPVVIENVLVGQRPVDPTRTVRIASRPRDVELRFAALSFDAPRSLRYRYRLEGLDADWVDADTRRSAFYSHLPPGSYRFRVTARSRDGIWNEAGATVAIEVPAELRETSVFYALCLAAAVGLGFGFARWRARHLRRRQLAMQANEARLERLVAVRTARLESANRELEAFAYSVSHDLRSPLRAIDGAAGILLEDHADRLDEDGRKSLAGLRRNVRSMARLIEDLLRFSRSIRQELRRERVDMTAIVRRVWAELAAGDPRPESLELSLAELPEAVADPPLIRQVWINLLSNALKFSTPVEQRKIAVRGHREGTYSVYTVEDNGVGFDMTHAGKLFESFERLHGRGEFEGTGLGLSLVQRIVRRHGGEVTGAGQLGRGAAFTFTIPDQEPAEGDPAGS